MHKKTQSVKDSVAEALKEITVLEVKKDEGIVFCGTCHCSGHM